MLTVRDYKPEIDVGETPPAVYDGPKELTPREQALGQYAGELKKKIKTYNDWARQQNIKNHYLPVDVEVMK
jgi:hypothetical protein